MRFLTSIYFEKTSEKVRKSRILATPAAPQTFQNPFQIDIPKNKKILNAFLEAPFKNQSLETLKISIFPRENHYFSGFRKNKVFAFWASFASKKRSQNNSKTKAERLENRCHQRIMFRHHFVRVLASILASFGLPSWSQAGNFGPRKLHIVVNMAQLGLTKTPKALQERENEVPRRPKRQNEAKKRPETAKMRPQGASRETQDRKKSIG